jgi:hypothetical protein
VRFGALVLSLLLAASACRTLAGTSVSPPASEPPGRTAVSGDGLVEFRIPAGYERRNLWADCYHSFREYPYTFRDFCVEIVDSVSALRLTVADDSTRLASSCFDCAFFEEVHYDTIAFTPHRIVRERGLLTGTIGHYRRKPYWVLRIWLDPDVVAVVRGDDHGEDAARRELHDIARSIRLRPPSDYGPRSDSAVYAAALRHLIPAGDSAILRARISAWWGFADEQIDTLANRASVPRALFEALRSRPAPVRPLEALIGGWPRADFVEGYDPRRSSPDVPDIYLSPVGYDERTKHAIVNFYRECGNDCLTHGFLIFRRGSDGAWRFVRFQPGLAF